MKLFFDDGIKEFETNNGQILRFNPSDPAFYDRFRTMITKIEKAETELDVADPKTGDEVLDLMCEYDHKIKCYLNEAFGLNNDFEKIFSGVNMMAVGKNGHRIIGNFLDAIQPIIEEGAKQHAKSAAADVVAQARARREARS
ncbi:MAG: hypothetical protein IKM48_03140 [Clostridia bacterium]|nr:hypothetical protein [Clostridia bacterium]